MEFSPEVLTWLLLITTLVLIAVAVFTVMGFLASRKNSKDIKDIQQKMTA